MTQIPPGCDLSFEELVAALRWKVENRKHEKMFAVFNAAIGGHSLHEREALTTQLDQLRTDLALVRIRLAAQRNCFASINLLPVEIISNIFELQRPSGHFPALKELTAWSCSTASVCCHWRSVALSKPAFWRNIHLPTAHQRFKDASIAAAFLKRCSPLPIRLRYSRPLPSKHNSRHDIQKEFVMALVEAPERLEYLKVNATSFPQELRPILQKQLPVLRVLWLQMGNFYDETVETLVGDLDTPHLERLVLTNIQSVPRTLSRLTHLEIQLNRFDFNDSYSTQTLCNMLRQTPLLERLQVTGSRPFTINCEHGPPVRLPHLTEVALKIGNQSLGDLFSTLHHMQIHPYAKISLRYTGVTEGGQSLNVPSTISDRVTGVMLADDPRALVVSSDYLAAKESALSHLSSCLHHARLLVLPRWPATAMLCGFKTIQTIHCWMVLSAACVFAASLKEEESLLPELVSWTFWLGSGKSVASEIKEHLSAERIGEVGPNLFGGEVVTVHKSNGSSFKAQMLRTKRDKLEIQWIKNTIAGSSGHQLAGPGSNEGADLV